MSIPSGLSGAIGFATESSYGTAVTVTRFLPVVSENVSQEIARLESKAIVQDRRVLDSDQWAAGNRTISGPIALELYDHSMGTMFQYMFGAGTTTGSGTYTHTFTPGDLTADSFTYQAQRPDTAGTIRAFTYAGCQVSSWELAFAQGEIATLGLEIVGKSETTGTAAASTSYAADLIPVHFRHAVISVAGSSRSVKSITLSGDNGLDVERRFLGTDTIAQPLEATKRTYEGTMEVEFDSLTEYGRYTGATEFALVITCTAGTNTITITCNVRYDGATPGLAGEELLTQSIPFKCIGSTDAAAITAVLVNTDSAI